MFRFVVRNLHWIHPKRRSQTCSRSLALAPSVGSNNERQLGDFFFFFLNATQTSWLTCWPCCHLHAPASDTCFHVEKFGGQVRWGKKKKKTLPRRSLKKKEKKSHFLDTPPAHVMPSEARRLWFMAALHEFDERFTRASLRRGGWFEETKVISGHKSNCGARSHPGARNTSWVSGGLVFQSGVGQNKTLLDKTFHFRNLFSRV